MKTSTKLFALALLILPFISWAGLYWYAKTIELINLDYPNEKLIQHVKNINDIEAVKKLFISEVNSNQVANNSDVSLFNSYASMLLSLAICNAVFLFMFYRGIVQKSSNKSSNLTGANDAPSS